MHRPFDIIVFVRGLLPVLAMGIGLTPAVAEEGPRMPVLPNAEAWQRLPSAPEKERPLPAWARMLAGPMPLTTARMLELDAMHRGGDRLDARLRCLVRWAAADANGCDYSKAVAAGDLRRARNADADIADLLGRPEELPELDRAAVAFARKMMLEAHAVTDEEVAHILKLAGEERTVALVTLLAHASFQDRVLLALGVPSKGAGDVPPVYVLFGRPEPPKTEKPRTPAPEPERDTRPTDEPAVTTEWLRLRQGLVRQRERVSRIRVPSKEEVLARIGTEHPAAWQSDIIWSRVCYGYQPELTQAWFDCASAFRAEARISPGLQNDLFWVVTHSNKCFY